MTSTAIADSRVGSGRPHPSGKVLGPLSDTWVMIRRNLHISRAPLQLSDVTIQPLIFTLLFPRAVGKPQPVRDNPGMADAAPGSSRADLVGGHPGRGATGRNALLQAQDGGVGEGPARQPAPLGRQAARKIPLSAAGHPGGLALAADSCRRANSRNGVGARPSSPARTFGLPVMPYES